MIYLASLYSLNAKTDSEVDINQREVRYNYTLKRLQGFLCDGKIVFSPIAHCHEVSKHFGLPKEYSFFKTLDHSFLDKCDEIYILMMSDSKGSWVDSEGILDEISYAMDIGLKTTYISCHDYN